MLAGFPGSRTGLESCGWRAAGVLQRRGAAARTARRFFDALGAELHNLYGPTEAAVDVTYLALRARPPAADVPIGRPDRQYADLYS